MQTAQVHHGESVVHLMRHFDGVSQFVEPAPVQYARRQDTLGLSVWLLASEENVDFLRMLHHRKGQRMHGPRCANQFALPGAVAE